MNNSSYIFRSIIKTTCNYFVFAVLFILASSKLQAQTTDSDPLNFPVPKANNMLFYLQRDPTINTVIYALNVDEKGNVNREDPLNIYWIRYTEGSIKKDLSYIQRKFAFGIDSKEVGKDKYELRFVSRKTLVFMLQRNDKGYYVSIALNNKNIKVTRIYVKIEGGSFWLPNVKYADIEGTDLATGKPVSERISIK
jgi:hypothetical protein